MSPVRDSSVCGRRITRFVYSAGGAGAGAAQDAATGAQHDGAAGAQHDTGAGSQHGSGQQAFLCRSFRSRRPENRRQRRLPHGSQQGSGSQQTGAGAQQVGAAGAQHVAATGAQQDAATGAQQDGAAHVASGAHESQLDLLKWPNKPASTD